MVYDEVTAILVGDAATGFKFYALLLFQTIRGWHL
jgi:hypothetical protein